MTNNYREFSDEYNEKEKLICLTENDILAYAKGKNIHIWHIENNSVNIYKTAFPLSKLNLRRPRQT